MWVHSFLVSLAVSSIAAIKVPLPPLDNTRTKPTVPIITEQILSQPIYYEYDESSVDSHVILPDTNKPDVGTRDAVPTPATYLLPPSPDKQNEYFVKPTEPGEQTEWYPIAATPVKQQDTIPLIQDLLLNPNEARGSLRTGKVLHRGQVITVPSRNILPPRENAQDDFVVLSPSAELELPSEEIDHTLNQHIKIDLPVFRPPFEKTNPVHFRVNPELPVPYITPPENVPQSYKNPTRLYPKKYINEFKPIPIPVSQYEKESEDETRTVKPRFHDTIIHHDIEYTAPSKEKKNYLYEETQKKREQQSENAKQTAETHIGGKPAEQETSESNHRHHGNHVHPIHPRKQSSKQNPEHNSKGERTEFRMHGMKGPHSYQFGYDTGKGKNRQFRYEERDNDGHVRGHYGYVDKFGKLRVVNYDADPEHGFRAEAPVVTD